MEATIRRKKVDWNMVIGGIAIGAIIGMFTGLVISQAGVVISTAMPGDDVTKILTGIWIATIIAGAIIMGVYGYNSKREVEEKVKIRI